MGQQDYDQKLDALLTSAARIFAERGYHQTSMRDLAGATGGSLSGLYYYVKSKEELLFLIQDRHFAAVVESLNEALEGITDPIDQLGCFISNHLEYFASHMPEMKVLSHEAGSLTGEWLAKVNARKREYTLTLMDILSRIEASNGPAHANRRVAAYSIFGMMNWIYNWYDPLGDLDVRLLGQNMTRIFLGGYIGHPVADSSLPRTTAG
jgi:TetR/AcrR family transcriptional regulator, cholesterol catabolism regulator